MTTIKLRFLQCFREMIPDYVQIGTELYRCLLLRYTIIDEILSDIYVACPLAT